MDRKQLVDTAHQASMTVTDNDDWEDGLAFVCDIAALERFAALVAAHEREQCARVCAEAYQVVGSLLSDLGQFDTAHAEKILDNLSQAKIVHDDVLPWPSFEQTEVTPSR